MRRSMSERWRRIGVAAAILVAVAVVVLVVDTEPPADAPPSLTTAATPSEPVAREPEPQAADQEDIVAEPLEQEREQLYPANGSEAEPEWRLADRAALAALTIAPEDDGGVRYDRDRYDRYQGRDENGCNQRDRILWRDARRIDSVDEFCNTEGEWYSWLDGLVVSDESEIQIDHLVAFSEAHDSGAWKWSEQRLDDFAADDETLSAVSRRSNRAKSDSDPAEWKPPRREAWCRYARDWIRVKLQYELTADQAEMVALADMLESCSGPSPDSAAQDRRTTRD